MTYQIDTPMDGLKRCVEALCLIRDGMTLVGCWPDQCDESVGHFCLSHGFHRVACKALTSVGVTND